MTKDRTTVDTLHGGAAEGEAVPILGYKCSTKRHAALHLREAEGEAVPCFGRKWSTTETDFSTGRSGGLVVY
jgi:hypothetical protein